MIFHQLPYDLLLSISEYLTYKDLVAWVATDRHFAHCITPILYRSVQPYDSSCYSSLYNAPSPRGCINSRSLIFLWAVKHGLLETIKNVVEAEDIRPFINHRIARNGCVARLGSLGMTPLHQAALHGQADIIRILVSEYGADVDLSLGGFLRPIHLAQNESVVRCLVSLGSSIHHNGKGMSPLMYAISTNAETSAVKCFLEFGSDPNYVSTDGTSAGHMTLRVGNIEALELLLQSGLEVSNPSPPGGSLIFHAIDCLQATEPEKCLSAVQLLLKYGAPAQGGIMIGWSPYDITTLRSNVYHSVSRPNCSRVVKLLLEHGANSETGHLPEKDTRWEPEAFVYDNWSSACCRQTPLGRLIFADVDDCVEESTIRDKLNAMSELVRWGAKLPLARQPGALLKHLLFDRLGYPGWDDVMLFALDHGLDPWEANGLSIILDQFLDFGWMKPEYSLGLLKVLRRLLEMGLDPNQLDGNRASSETVLMKVCAFPLFMKAADIIKLMISYGGDVNQTRHRYGHVWVPLLGLINRCGSHPLCSESVDRVEALLSSGNQDVTSLKLFPEPPLVFLTKEGPGDVSRQIMGMLLRHGADIHARFTNERPEMWVDEHTGYTALHMACTTDDPKVVSFLLDHGADKDVNTVAHFGATPLIVLIESSARRNTNKGAFLDMKRLLLDAGANISVKTADGKHVWELCIELLPPEWIQPSVVGDLGCNHYKSASN